MFITEEGEMNKNIIVGSLGVLLVVGVVGCSQPQKPQAANSSEAIQQSQAMATTQEKVQYLVKEANAFINSQNFDQAVQTAKYILSNLDQNSADAKSILERAQVELKKLADQKLQEAQANMQKKLGIGK